MKRERKVSTLTGKLPFKSRQVHKPKVNINACRKEMAVRSFQISGFAKCLYRFAHSHLKNIPLDVVHFEKISQITKDLPIKDLPKWFKGVLCYNFSKYNKQELPDVLPESKIDFKQLFRCRFHSKLRGLVRSERRRVVNLWDLMQSKGLSNKVPDDFIQDTLEKYRSMMDTPSKPITRSTIVEVLEFMQPYLKHVRTIYDGKTKLPNGNSCYDHSRSEGGNREFCRKFLQHSRPLLPDNFNRYEPIVLCLTGPPGSGKSKMIKFLCDRITKRFNVSSKSVYDRNPTDKFWEGYNGQLITVIDDLGATLTVKNGLDAASEEFIGLVSTNQQQLNMAFSNKGKTFFTSPFIIVTSNKAIDMLTHPNTVFLSEPAAFRRRIHFRYHVEDNQAYPMHYEEYDDLWKTSTTPVSAQYVLSNLYEKYSTYRGVISQEIQDSGYSLEFPKYPIGENRVKVSAIPEALKCRVITRPQGLTYVLKPLQLALFKALRQYNCFRPCWEPVKSLDFIKFDDEFYLSGDYTAATDDISLPLYESIGNLLARYFPELAPHILWETRPHMIEFPVSSGLTPVLQKTGQLMGSLLSFPILCIINAFTIAKAKNKTLDTLQDTLIHGDDILTVATLEQFHSWKSNAASVGLTLSMGKNYLSKDWGSIDSQIFYKGEYVPTGKYSLLKKDEFNSIIDAQRHGFSKTLIRNVMRKALSQTKRSLDIPLEYGGLSLEPGVRNILTPFEHALYSLTMRNRNRIVQLPDNRVRMPLYIGHSMGLKPTNFFSYDEEELGKDIHKLESKAMKIAYKFDPIDINQLVPLTEITSGEFIDRENFSKQGWTTDVNRSHVSLKQRHGYGFDD